MLLVTAGGGADPIDALVRKSTGARPPDPDDNEGYYENAGERSNRKVMADWAKAHDTLAKHGPAGLPKFMVNALPVWRRSLRNSFGQGRAGQYARRNDEGLGLITDESNDIILRVERELDYAMLKDDVVNHKDRITTPSGRGHNIAVVAKTVAISGSLRPEQWDATLVVHAIYGGLPFLFLPHVAKAPLNHVPNDWTFMASEFSTAWQRARMAASGRPYIVAAPGLLDQWQRTIEDSVRRRLRHLPGGYDFFVQKVLRELTFVCLEIARFVGQDKSNLHEVAALAHDLNKLAVRGIALGVESLVWHCEGFDPGCEPSMARKALRLVRSQGQVSRRDIQRKHRQLKAAAWDVVLQRLAAEGLVTLDGRMVTAVTLPEFVRSLPNRAGYPEPVLLSAVEVNESNKDPKAPQPKKPVSSKSMVAK